MNQKAERLGILGGTFNPIHHGHLLTARAARESLDLDRLILLPNSRSPLRMGEPLADPAQRLEMVRLAVAEEPGLEACDLEVRREGPSFLVDTLKELKTLYPHASFTFLMGMDSLETFDRWREVTQIVALARVMVLPRSGGNADKALADLEIRAPALKGCVSLLEGGPHIDISATEVRERIRQGKSIRYLVPDPVAAYIARHRLFV